MPVLRKGKEMEEKEVVIRIRHLSKEYRLGVIGRGTLQRDFQSWWARKRGKPDPNQRIGRREYTSKECFYALEDVSFDVHRGERAVTYRDKKIKPLFLQIKNKVAVMAAQVKELTKEVEGWKRKYQKVKQKYNAIQRELDDIRKDNQKLSEEKDILQGVSDRYDRVVRVLGIETVDTAVQQDIQNEKVLEEKRRMEQMPKGNIHERLAWGMKKSEMENQQRKKTKSKNREMER